MQNRPGYSLACPYIYRDESYAGLHVHAAVDLNHLTCHVA